MDLGHWTYLDEIPEDPYGFIYQITNITTGKKYIGKKQMVSIKKYPPLKGKRNKRHKKVETDWKTYTGSSDVLNEDIKKLGKDKFKFEILEFCNSKSHLAYVEAKKQFENDVLLREDFYNSMINLRVSKIKF